MDVFAIRYAIQRGNTRAETFVDPVPGEELAPLPLACSFWLLREGERTVLVDTGLDRSVAHARGYDHLELPENVLRRLGVRCEDVRDVVLTHTHYDHIGNLDLFPRARFHIQAAELAHAFGPAMAKPGGRSGMALKPLQDLLAAMHGDRLVVHDGDVALFPGVALRRFGGHTPGIQSVLVEAGGGDPLLIASDVVPFTECLRSLRPMQGSSDVPLARAALELIAQGAAARRWRVLPSHDDGALEALERVPGEPNVFVAGTARR